MDQQIVHRLTRNCALLPLAFLPGPAWEKVPIAICVQRLLFECPGALKHSAVISAVGCATYCLLSFLGVPLATEMGVRVWWQFKITALCVFHPTTSDDESGKRTVWSTYATRERLMWAALGLVDWIFAALIGGHSFADSFDIQILCVDFVLLAVFSRLLDCLRNPKKDKMEDWMDWALTSLGSEWDVVDFGGYTRVA